MRKTCADCGRAFAPRHARQTRCEAHELRGREHRSPTTRAQDAEYARVRCEVLVEEPTCWVAGCSEPSTTVDHVVPVSRGGTHARGNLRGCCPHHNFSRRDDPDWTPDRAPDLPAARPEERPPSPGALRLG